VRPAIDSHPRIRFHQVHEPSGKRIRYEKVVPGIGPVDPDDIVKGFDLGKSQYDLLEQEAIDAIRLEAKRTLDLVQFVGRGGASGRRAERSRGTRCRRMTGYRSAGSD
jgi:DNA end-binding protein Ku